MTKKLMIILVSFFLSSSLIAEDIKIDDIYEVYVSKSKNIFCNENDFSREIYFGKYIEYIKKNSEDINNLNKNAIKGFEVGLGTSSSGAANSVGNATGKAVGQGLGLGLGIGLVFGLGELVYDNLTEDNIYILVSDYKNSNGEQTRISVLLITNSFTDEIIIKKFLKQEILKKIKD